MPRTHTRNTGTPVPYSAGRQTISAHNLQPGCIVWLPALTVERDEAMRGLSHRNEVQLDKTDRVLPPEAHDHPVVILEVTNPNSTGSNRNAQVTVATLTSFGYTAGCEDTCRLSANRGRASWDSFAAIAPCDHPSNNDILYLQRGKLDKPSYVKMKRVDVRISILRTYTRGASAAACDVRLTTESYQLLFRKLGMRAAAPAPEWGSGVGGEAPALPLLLSQPVSSSPGRLAAQHSMPMPYRHERLACEHTSLIHNAQRSSRQALVSSSYTRINYGSTYTAPLPPPVTWEPGRASKISRSSNNIDWGNILRSFMGFLFLLLLGFVIVTACYGLWVFFCWIFFEIGHWLASTWESVKEFIVQGWSTVVEFSSNSWHNFLAWLESLLGK